MRLIPNLLCSSFSVTDFASNKCAHHFLRLLYLDFSFVIALLSQNLYNALKLCTFIIEAVTVKIMFTTVLVHNARYRDAKELTEEGRQ